MAGKTVFVAQKDHKRLDQFLQAAMPEFSRSQLEKMIKAGQVTVNQSPVTRKSHFIKNQDQIEVKPMPSGTEKKFRPTHPLDKLYEDDTLLIINKPSGIAVHPGAGPTQETILDIFRYYYPQIDNMPDQERPGIVHRLDKETSGVLLLAKDHITMKRLQKQFRRREVGKHYLALLSGKLRYKNGTITLPLVRSSRNRKKFIVSQDSQAENAREAVTDYEALIYVNHVTLARLTLHTGRTHQIRVHMAHQGNPVLGDKLYGSEKSFERLALHAWSIRFTHPSTGTILKCRAPIPAAFRDFIRSSLKQDQRQDSFSGHGNRR